MDWVHGWIGFNPVINIFVWIKLNFGFHSIQNWIEAIFDWLKLWLDWLQSLYESLLNTQRVPCTYRWFLWLSWLRYSYELLSSDQIHSWISINPRLDFGHLSWFDSINKFLQSSVEFLFLNQIQSRISINPMLGWGHLSWIESMIGFASIQLWF